MPGARVFISYKREQPETQLILNELQDILFKSGYTPLIDETIEAGNRWSDTLYHWLLECSAAIAILSSEAHNSTWCRREWEILAARARADCIFRLIPIRINADVPYPAVFEEGHFQRIDWSETKDWTSKIISSLEGIKPWQSGRKEYLSLHRGWLENCYSIAPALGHESFSLSDIYTPLDCGSISWGEIRGERNLKTKQGLPGETLAGNPSNKLSSFSSSTFNPIDPFKEINGGRSDLLDTVLELIGDSEFHDAIVIQGPGGCGKSGFTGEIKTCYAYDKSSWG